MKITKKYWLKIENGENIKFLKEENKLGLSYSNARFRPKALSFKDIEEEDLMVIYVKGEKSFYLSKVTCTHQGKKERGNEWVHFIDLGPLHNDKHYIGKIENWDELKEKLTFWKKYKNIGLALRCSMIEIDELDFTEIKNFLK